MKLLTEEEEASASFYEPVNTIFYTLIDGDAGKKFFTSVAFYGKFLLQDDYSRKVYQVKNAFCLVSKLPIFEVLKKFLIRVLELYHDSMLHVTKQNYSIEFLLSLLFHTLYFNSSYQNEIRIIDSISDRKPFLQYRNYREYGFTLPNFCFDVLIKKVPVEMIVTLVKALLLEKNVILIQESTYHSAIIIESLLCLLTPFQWNLLQISYLTLQSAEYIEAPVPYIMGISKPIWDYLKIEISSKSNNNKSNPNNLKANTEDTKKGESKKVYTIYDETLIYDVDNNKIIKQPFIPQLLIYDIEKNLVASMNKIIENKKEISSKVPSTSDPEVAEGYYWAYATLSLKQLFFDYFIMMMNNFMTCYYPEVKESQKNSANEIFNFSMYTEFHKHDPFIVEFSNTSNFAIFIEHAHYSKNKMNDIGFFICCIEKVIKNKCFGNLCKAQKEFINHILGYYINPITFSLESCFTRYLELLGQSTMDNKPLKKKCIIDQSKIIQTPLIDNIPRSNKQFFMTTTKKENTSIKQSRRTSDNSQSQICNKENGESPFIAGISSKSKAQSKIVFSSKSNENIYQIFSEKTDKKPTLPKNPPSMMRKHTTIIQRPKNTPRNKYSTSLSPKNKEPVSIIVQQKGKSTVNKAKETTQPVCFFSKISKHQGDLEDDMFIGS